MVADDDEAYDLFDFREVVFFDSMGTSTISIAFMSG